MTKKEYCKEAWLMLEQKGYRLNDKVSLGIVNNLMAEFAINMIKNTNSQSEVRYTTKLDDFDDDIYTIDEWENAVNIGMFTNYDGSGYWVKDGLKSHDEVFSTPKLDATHVVWYNK